MGCGIFSAIRVADADIVSKKQTIDDIARTYGCTVQEVQGILDHLRDLKIREILEVEHKKEEGMKVGCHQHDLHPIDMDIAWKCCSKNPICTTPDQVHFPGDGTKGFFCVTDDYELCEACALRNKV